MAMELETRQTTVQASRQKLGIGVYTIEPGKALRIETTPGGVEILDVECPAGSTWTVQISVIINELDD